MESVYYTIYSRPFVMKTILITFITPASENIGGTSALPYHLLVERNKDIDIIIYSFNANKLSGEKIAEVENELGVVIKMLPLPKWYVWMFRLHLLFLRIFMKYPFGNYIQLPQHIVDEIKAQHPDLIWVMGEELSRIIKQFPQHRRVHLGPDTESLYYYRMMGRRFVMNNALDFWKCALMYRKYVRMERDFPTDENYTYLAVGEEDVRHLQQLNPNVKAKFLRHPHYDINENGSSNLKFSQPIKLLVAGQYNLYMQQAADELLEELKNSKIEELKMHYLFTFLGKGWEKHVENMKSVGYNVQHIKFAPDYIEEISKHDIQITPIAIGTGTKGKVLDALANGLMVIGTSYALENIAVESGVSCIEYQHPHEVINVLYDIPQKRKKYEMIALAGRKAVLQYHDRHLISKELISL